ncbi:MAG TPA: DUF1499 domain-containing protein [Longimicrobiales bacterium]
MARRLFHALTRNAVATAEDHWDSRLRGRTYAIPFEQVWQASLALANGGLRRWKVISSDDYEGVINAEAKTLFWRFKDDVMIRVYLDENAQTRVDLQSRSRKGAADFGTNARRVHRFLRALDRKLMPPAKKPAR